MQRLVNIHQYGETVKGFLSNEGCDKYKLVMTSQVNPPLFSIFDAKDNNGNDFDALEIMKLAEKELAELYELEQLILNTDGQTIYKQFLSFDSVFSKMVTRKECDQLMIKLRTSTGISTQDIKKIENVLKKSSVDYRKFRDEVIDNLFVLGEKKLNPKFFDQFIAIMRTK